MVNAPGDSAAVKLVQPLVPGFFHLATLVAFEIFIGEQSI